MNHSNADPKILQTMVCTIFLTGFLLFTSPMSAGLHLDSGPDNFIHYKVKNGRARL